MTTKPKGCFFTFVLSVPCAVTLLLVNPALSVAANSLIPYQITYEAKYNGLPITAQRELIKTENGYQLRTLIKNLLGHIEEVETFSMNEQGLIQVESYHYNQKVLGVTREEVLMVDREANIARYSRKKKRREIPLQPGYLGPMSYQLQMRRDLQNQKDRFVYPVMIRGRLREYRFALKGEETLDTPIGKVKALKMYRLRDDDERETVIWLAPELNYLAVKIQQQEDSEKYEMLVKNWQAN